MVIRYLLQDVNRYGSPQFSVLNALDHRLSIVVKKDNFDVFLGIYTTGFLVLLVMKKMFYHLDVK